MGGYIGSQIPSFTSDVTSASGDFTVGSDLTVNSDATVSGGIYLGGTGSANYLDDYEEGTWTPAFSGPSSVTYTQQAGRYVKIGRAVHIQGVIVWSAYTASASNANLGGLPFTPEGTDNFINSVSIYPANGTAYEVAYEYISSGLLFFYNNSTSLGGGASTNPYGSSGSIIINGIYYA